VSFQLPSLKIESFPIDLIEEISSTRKGGLTFAVETALDVWQKAVNKVVSIEKIENILKEAVNKGYKVAKFYFMIGIFLNKSEFPEEDAIIDLMDNILQKVPNIRINITLATFVPKPFTPFQWNSQLDPNEASRKIYKIKDAFKNNPRIKISYNSPYLSWLEGIIARGDERVGELIINAFKKGARFDAWDDLFNKSAWENTLSNSDELIKEIMMGKDCEHIFPWSSISLMVSNKYLRLEYTKSRQSLLTSKCETGCMQPCGSCSDGYNVIDSKHMETIIERMLQDIPAEPSLIPTDQKDIRILFKYSKTGRAAYIPHHDIHSMLCKAFELSKVRFALSQGFNPMPRLEISEPLSLGYNSLEEYGFAKYCHDKNIVLNDELLEKINSRLHVDLQIEFMLTIDAIDGLKMPSLSSIHWGSMFRLDFNKSLMEIKIFKDGFAQLIMENNKLSEANISMSSNSTIDVLLPFTGIKELGLAAIFKKIYGTSIRESGISVTRMQQYAKNNNAERTTYDTIYSKYGKSR
jgi:hypothetical protein